MVPDHVASPSLHQARHSVNSTGRRNTSMMRCCDAETETETVRPGGSACDAFAWSAAGNGGVRSSNGSGRRSRGGCRVRMPLCPVACRRPWVVVGSVRAVVCRRSAWRPDRLAPCPWRSGKRSRSCELRAPGCATWPVGSGESPVDCLARATSQRGDSERRSGVSGVDCAVAQRPTCQAPEDRQAGRERSAEELRAGPPRRHSDG